MKPTCDYPRPEIGRWRKKFCGHKNCKKVFHAKIFTLENRRAESQVQMAMWKVPPKADAFCTPKSRKPIKRSEEKKLCKSPFTPLHIQKGTHTHSHTCEATSNVKVPPTTTVGTVLFGGKTTIFSRSLAAACTHSSAWKLSRVELATSTLSFSGGRRSNLSCTNWVQCWVTVTCRAVGFQPTFSFGVWAVISGKPRFDPLRENPIFANRHSREKLFSLTAISQSAANGRGWENRSAGVARANRRPVTLTRFFSLQINKKRRIFCVFGGVFSWSFLAVDLTRFFASTKVKVRPSVCNNSTDPGVKIPSSTRQRSFSEFHRVHFCLTHLSPHIIAPWFSPHSNVHIILSFRQILSSFSVWKESELAEPTVKCCDRHMNLWMV